MEKAREKILKIFNLLMRPEMRILPGNLAYYIIITIIPLVALIATIAAALSISTEAMSSAITSSVPSEIAGILNGIVAGEGISFNLIIFYITAFILASNGTYSMINISNEIYKVEPNKIISRRIKAIIMIFILVSLFTFLLLVPVFGTTLFTIITEVLQKDEYLNKIDYIFNILKYPITIVILYVNIKLMYIIAPDKEIPGKTTTKGSIFTTIGWILSTEIFTFYIEKFANYDIFYGSLSNILVLVLWVYLLAYIFVLGMIINATDYKGEL